jgi:ATP-dependent RNA helicase DDX3X
VQVETSGRDVPAPAFSFDELNLGKVLLRNVSFNHYSKPTPVQQYSIPISMAGRDIMACAQTGSGKTAAFTFPILYCLLKRGQSSGGGRRAMPSALALAPTRELAIQIQEESAKFSFHTGLRKSREGRQLSVSPNPSILLLSGDLTYFPPGQVLALRTAALTSVSRCGT